MFPQLFSKEYYYSQDYKNEIKPIVKTEDIDSIKFHLYDLATQSFYFYNKDTTLKISCQATF